MSLSCSINRLGSFELGLVLVKFDRVLGPVVLINNSDLENEDLLSLSMKGTSSLMSNLEYNLANTRKFRGIIQIKEDLYAYGFDLVLIDDKGDRGSLTPVMVFIIFESCNIPVIGANIQSIEEILSNQTKTFLNLSHITLELSLNILNSLREILS